MSQMTMAQQADTIGRLEADLKIANGELTSLRAQVESLRPAQDMNVSLERIANTLERFDKVLLTPGNSSPNYGLLEKLVDFIAAIQRQTGG